jgi:hypothetical protein
MKCRLKTNIILDGKFIERDNIIDDQLLPASYKTEAVISYDVQVRDDGKVLVLRDLAFQSVPSKGADGVPTSYPVHVMTGELLDLTRVPSELRKSLKEGSDYATKWTREEQQQLQKAAQDAYLKQFQPEPAVQPSR